MKKFILAIGVVVTGISCSHKDIPRTPQQVDKEYNQLQTHYSSEVTQSLMAMGLPKPTITSHPGSEHLTISFGKLTPAQFELAKKYFFYSRLPSAYAPVYDAQKNYELIDFLPPKVQALANRRTFEGFEMSTPTWFKKYMPQYLGFTPETLLTQTNCWGTVHDVLISTRFPTKAILFNIDDIVSYYQNPKFFSSVSNVQNLKPYDVILYYYESDGARIVDHAALYLGHGLIYQKDGLSEMDHYKITFLKQRSGLENHMYYRPLDKVPIQTVEELYGFSNKKPKISSSLAAELKDANKKAFFDSLVLQDNGANKFFTTTAIKLALTKNAKTGRWEYDKKTYPGTNIVDPLKKKPTF